MLDKNNFPGGWHEDSVDLYGRSGPEPTPGNMKVLQEAVNRLSDYLQDLARSLKELTGKFEEIAIARNTKSVTPEKPIENHNQA